MIEGGPEFEILYGQLLPTISWWEGGLSLIKVSRITTEPQK
jgi:hypothetical protein